MPSVTCAGGATTYSSQWIGIDGYSSDTVEQDGKGASCQAGTPYYNAWYEMYGDEAVDDGYEVPLSNSGYPVSPGDAMIASVELLRLEVDARDRRHDQGLELQRRNRPAGAAAGALLRGVDRGAARGRLVAERTVGLR